MRVRESGSIVVPHKSRPQQRKVPVSTIAQRAVTAGVQAVNRPSPHQARVNRAGSFAFNPRASVPIRREQHHAQTRTRRADQKALPRPYPVVPPLRNPTPRQVQAAQQLARRSLQGQLPRNPTVADQQRVIRQLQNDPRTAHLVQNLAQVAASHATVPTVFNPRAHEGKAPRTLSAGIGPQINLTALGRTITAATTLNQGDIGPRHIFGNALKDVRDISTGPFVGGVEAGHAALDIATLKGTGRARNLISSLAQGYAHSLPVELATGDMKGVQNAILQHPLMSALDVSAAGAVIGRTSGALARAASRGRIQSVVRPPIALGEDVGAPIRQRTYSKDAIRREAQRTMDAKRQPLTDAQGNPVTITDRGRQVPVLKATPKERERLNRSRANFTAGRANAVERLSRDHAGHQVVTAERSVKVSKAAREVVSMAVEGTVRTAATFERDLRKHRDRIAAQIHQQETGGQPVYRHGGDLESAKNRVATIDRVLNSPKALAQAEKAYEVAQRHGRDLNTAESAAIDKGLLDKEAVRRRYMTWALEHMDARHVTVDEHKHLETQAKVIEQQALSRALSIPKGPARDAAMRDFHTARTARIAVSGRHPVLVHKHEQSVAVERATHRRMKVAQAKVAQAERARARVIGAKQARPDKNYDVALARAEANITAAQTARKATEQQWRAARHATRENPMPDIAAGLRNANGTHLPTRAIIDNIRQTGRDPNTVAYLPHTTSVQGARAYHSQFRAGGRPNLERERTTGSAYQKGIPAVGQQVIRDEYAHKATQIAKADQIDRFIEANAVRHPAWAKAKNGAQLTKHEQRIVDKGGAFTAKEAVELAKRVEADTGERLIAVRGYGSKLTKDTQQKIRENFQDPVAMESVGQRILNDRVVTEADLAQGARNVYLVPAAQIEHQLKHLRPAGDIRRMLQYLNRAFRMAVLPQPRWLIGNFIEPYVVRLSVAGSGLVNLPGMGADVAAGVRVLKAMKNHADPKIRQAATEVEAGQLGGLFIGGRGATIRRTSQDLPGVLKAGSVVRHMPVVKQMADLAGGLLNGFFRANRVIERGAQYAALGKSIRNDVHAFTGQWHKSVILGKQAVDEAARGLTNTPTQERFLRVQHELLGQYDSFPPAVRELIQGPMPFLPWAMAAARFTYWTMPAHHTLLTATLVKTQQAVQDQWNTIHKDVPPGSLRFALPSAGGGLVDVARYTPYSLPIPISEGDASVATDQILPQISGTVAAIQGQDPFGRPLSTPNGQATKGQKWAAAGNNFLEAVVPYLATARRLQEHGATAYSTSTAWNPQVKPDTSHMSAARRTFDPFRPTYLKRTKKGGGSFDFHSAAPQAAGGSFDFSSAKPAGP